MDCKRKFPIEVTATDTYWACVGATQDRIADAIASAMVRDGAKRVTIDLDNDHAWYAFSGESL